MRKTILLVIMTTAIIFSACTGRQAKEKEKALDTIPMMVMQIQKCSRLYTAEAQVHRIITHDDQLRLNGAILKHEFDISLPGGKRKVLTSSKIDHEGIKKFVSLTRSNFSDEELSSYEQEGRKGIINDIPRMDILETARQSAAHTLVPMLVNLGFKAENIKISFRKKFTSSDLSSLIDGTSVENK